MQIPSLRFWCQALRHEPHIVPSALQKLAGLSPLDIRIVDMIHRPRWISLAVGGLFQSILKCEFSILFGLQCLVDILYGVHSWLLVFKQQATRSKLAAWWLVMESQSVVHFNNCSDRLWLEYWNEKIVVSMLLMLEPPYVYVWRVGLLRMGSSS